MSSPGQGRNLGCGGEAGVAGVVVGLLRVVLVVGEGEDGGAARPHAVAVAVAGGPDGLGSDGASAGVAGGGGGGLGLGGEGEGRRLGGGGGVGDDGEGEEAEGPGGDGRALQVGTEEVGGAVGEFGDGGRRAEVSHGRRSRRRWKEGDEVAAVTQSSADTHTTQTLQALFLTACLPQKPTEWSEALSKGGSEKVCFPYNGQREREREVRGGGERPTPKL